jgi:threonine aldolase
VATSLIDLRSDTVTQPSDEMRRAMASAELGDDVFGEDPTVNRLEARAAELMGKEAALLVPSGTMGNLIGLLVNARSGQEVIVEADSHVFYYEGGGAATLGGIQLRPLPGRRGVLSPDQIEAAVRPRGDVHQPLTAAVSFEDSHNRHGGSVWPLEALREASGSARGHGIAVHLDGARIFNAALATGVSASVLAACADTVSFCLSKGLACPVGSLLAGSAEAITAGRRWRKMLGGGMRQAGVLAAAGLVALDTMVDRLAEDHRNAGALAEGLARIPGLACDADGVQTNIVMLHTPELPAAEFVAACRSRGLLALASGPERVRLVTHYGIERHHVEEALRIAEDAIASLRTAVP